MAETKYPLSLVIKAVDKATAPLRAISAKIAAAQERAAAPLRRLGNSFQALSGAAGLPKVIGGFRAVGAAAAGVGRQVFALGKAFAGLVTGALFGGAGLYSLVKGAMDSGDKLAEMADRVGLGVDAYASLQFAAAQADVDAETFNASMDKFNKSLSEAKRGAGPLAGLLEKVAPAMLSQLKGVKSNAEGLDLLAKAFERVEDPGRRAELAAAAFGKSGLGMGAFLKQGSAEIKRQTARYLELAGSQEAFAKGAGELDNTVREAEVAFLGLRNAVVSALFPALTKLAAALSNVLAGNRAKFAEWAERAGKALSAWVDSGGLERLVASLESFASAVSTVMDLVGGLQGALGLFAAFMVGKLLFSVWTFLGSIGLLSEALLATPVGWILLAIALIAGAVYLIIRYWGPIKGFFSQLWSDIVYLLNEAWISIRQLFTDPIGFFTQSWTQLKFFFADLWDTITDYAVQAWDKIGPIVDQILKVIPGFGLLGELGVGTMLFGAGGPPGSSVERNDARVQVDFVGLPKGTRVTPDRGNTAPLELNLGFSMVGQ